jgi:hypothetical protein
MNENALYLFADIPNDEEGQAFIRSLRKYRNPRYKMRVRGQGLNAEGHALGWRKFTYGAPLKYSARLRVYMEDTQK